MENRIQVLTMPTWCIEMEEGIIREWHAEEGKAINKGDIIAVIETEKIANDVELEFSGLLRRRLAVTEQAYPVGALLAVFADEQISDAELDAFIADFKPPDTSFTDEAGDEAQPTAKAEKTPETTASDSAEWVNISPKARSIAEQAGLDINKVTGTGRNGRISLQDVEQAIKAQSDSSQVDSSQSSSLQSGSPQSALPQSDSSQSGSPQGASPQDDTSNPYQEIALSPMRQAIAKHLSQALAMPHFYLRRKIAVDALIAHRAAQKEKNITPPTINDYLIKACAQSLKKVPQVNAHFVNDTLYQFTHADIAVAVSVPGGLITPIVRQADNKSVADIATEMRDLASRAKNKKLTPQEYQGGTFSLSNLGMYGIEGFDAVINPPMVAILAVGAIASVPYAREGENKRDGAIQFANQMEVCLSCDHRAIDGVIGSEFLTALKTALEAPQLL
ncbi:MAG: dihydrolipoamide acetyltransferase family protein [Alphaproteobacteria bacterium]|nr:dihydrolipoamide acetyltransferase family protein [Alphaproteobacteria bacterium]